MSVTVVLGAQWGDEGKGKIVDYLAQDMDMVIRFNGGPNAGHSVINEQGKFALHLVPSGIFNPKTICIIGNGLAVNPEILIGEIKALEEKGVSCRNLKISKAAHLIINWHTLLDGFQEEERGQGLIGTTGRGIGPVFADKAARFGIRVEDFLEKTLFQKKFEQAYCRYEKLFRLVYERKCLDVSYVLFNSYLEFREFLLPYIDDTEYIIEKSLAEKKKILLEGAQGFGLDVDFGTYPNVTSSVCTTNGALQGSSGISWKDITEVIGVVKAYATRVGSKDQPFLTEMERDQADILREQAHEYGTTTGRPRRIGWLDIFQLRRAAKFNGFTGLAVTRLDNLGILPQIKICCGYDKEGKPEYRETTGWGAEIGDCRSFCDLPFLAKNYIVRIETAVQVPVKYISVGPERNQTIVR